MNKIKPFSESCEQNKMAILPVLKRFLSDANEVLEIGSGTGQHAVFFAEQLPHVSWISSDQADYHEGIKLWLDEVKALKINGPLLLNVNQKEWPVEQVDAIFSANTVHIMDWKSVENMFAGIGRVLNQQGHFCLYGPFNYKGEFSSESNARFDIWLKQRDANSGVRDFEALQVLAENAGLKLINDIEMPANNRILVWQKS
ncbi:MAG TPA: DUF938 domain-containing protein [Gammaproteobacteria bacterium]|nr:DUF938 domain-containing protein [Gammaproteobacteria bacterium]